jgi:hypothetical protein
VDEELKKQGDALNAASGGPKSYNNTDAINQLYDAQRTAKAAELQAAYEQNRSNYQAAADKLPGQYQAQANDLAVQYERNKRNFNEQAARSGVNTGAGSQAELAQNAAWLRNYGQLRQAENDATTEAQRQLNDLYNNYTINQNAANAQIEAQRGAALIDEARQQYARDLDQAQNLAKYGDFSGYATIYGQDAANGMRDVWVQQNPDVAYITGRITADQRDNIVNGRPINDGLDANGVRIRRAAAGGNGMLGYNWDAQFFPERYGNKNTVPVFKNYGDALMNISSVPGLSDAQRQAMLDYYR